MTRRRLRDLGVAIGRFPTGPFNAITDVPGVHVGHATVRSADGQVHTGVTAILPNDQNVFMDRPVAGSFVLNGAGEMSGLIQVQEWGMIETPILLTNTMAVGSVSASAVRYLLTRYPGIGREHDVIIPVVGECDDSFLNDVTLHSIHEQHVFQALDAASSGPVAEGSVGGGTGMLAFDMKSGIGTSSRVVALEGLTMTVGVLVMSNFGKIEDFRVDGLPIGRELAPLLLSERRTKFYGSIIAVLATDAPLLPFQLNRLSKRVALALGRCGSYAAHGSGEIIIAFSTTNRVPRRAPGPTTTMQMLADRLMDPLYQSAIEATEESVVNALCMAEPTVGVDGNVAPALPVEPFLDALRKYGVVSTGRP